MLARASWGSAACAHGRHLLRGRRGAARISWAAERARELAGHLYVSIVQKLLALADDVEVHPGHGAGSLCGSRHRQRTAFHDWSGAPFQSDAATPNPGGIRRGGPARSPGNSAVFCGVEAIEPAGATAARPGWRHPGHARALPCRRSIRPSKHGATLIDLRQAAAFAQGHASGALNIGFGPKIGYWAGWVVPLTSPVVLLQRRRPETNRHRATGALAHRHRQRRRLRQGRVRRVARGRTADRPPRKHQCRRPASARMRTTDRITILDVRSKREFD